MEPDLIAPGTLTKVGGIFVDDNSSPGGTGSSGETTSRLKVTITIKIEEGISIAKAQGAATAVLGETNIGNIFVVGQYVSNLRLLCRREG